MRHRQTLAAVTLVLGLSILPGGCTPSGTRLVDAEAGKALADTEFKVWIDDGIRCVTSPCPTNAREWRGRTDGRGRFTPPEIGAEETAMVMVDGYRPAALEAGPTIELVRSVEPPRAQKLTLRAGFVDDAHTLEIRVANPGPESLSVIRPRPGRLARYGDWGGWHLLIKSGGNPYVPLPLPGPYVAASGQDIVTLAPGESLTTRVRLGDWRQAVPGTPQSQGTLMRDEKARVTARVRWSGMPEHLRADRGVGERP